MEKEVGKLKETGKILVLGLFGVALAYWLEDPWFRGFGILLATLTPLVLVHERVSEKFLSVLIALWLVAFSMVLVGMLGEHWFFYLLLALGGFGLLVTCIQYLAATIGEGAEQAAKSETFKGCLMLMAAVVLVLILLSFCVGVVTPEVTVVGTSGSR